MTVVTTAPRKRRRWGRLRGAVAVALLLLTALEALISAVTGWLPLSYVARRFAAPIVAAWRAAAWRSVPSVRLVTIRATPAPADEGNPDHGVDA